ncbi:hypothetical protein CPC08DRAFT_705082 [Agrocybe pediades]|nr:hypothetical protein CPC08DRAFT_705082 [Agrocybe pediades]
MAGYSGNNDSSDDLFLNTNRSVERLEELPILYITSFGHRRGPLHPTPDILVDIRKLPNPPKSMRTASQTGLHKPLREAFLSNDEVRKRFEAICEQIRSRLKLADSNGETQVHVAVCCELGKHRSVSMVEQLGSTRFDGWNVVVQHRDVHLTRSKAKGSNNVSEGGKTK